MKQFRHVCSAVLAASTIAAGLFTPAGAQETRYQQWQDPAKPDRVQQLVDKLHPLIDDAERGRAADPRFLSDLRAALRDFDKPWKVSLLRDDFSDGDYTHNPAWTPAAGQFWVEATFGLRSAVAASGPEPPPPSEEQRKLSRDEKAAKLFGAILNPALRGDQAGSGTAAAPAAPGHAAIETAAAITNAFSARVEVSSWAAPGEAEFAVRQAGGAGYMLIYAAGAQPSLRLERVTSRGSAVIDSAAIEPLEDRKLHRLEWNRAADGAMTVLLDDQEKIRTADRTFAGAFDRFRIVNRGGDYILRSVEILGTR
jgi:hypothetical protein